MLISKTAIIKLGGKNINHYRNLGYDFSGMWKEEIEIPIEDLIETSHVLVSLSCDFCGVEFLQAYRKHVSIMKNEVIKKDCCVNCIAKKGREYNILLHGVENSFQRKENQDKAKKTIFDRYGVENVSSLDFVKSKVSKRRSEKTAEQNIEMREKTEKTCLERYGVSTTLNLKKCRENLFKTRAIFSSQQKKIYDMLKDDYGDSLYINYTESPFSLDIALLTKYVKIDIEYDSWYWHNSQTDRKRDEVLKNKGYKILRIKSSRFIPEKKDLIKKINLLIETKKNFSSIVLKDWKEEEYLKKREDKK